MLLLLLLLLLHPLSGFDHSSGHSADLAAETNQRVRRDHQQRDDVVPERPGALCRHPPLPARSNQFRLAAARQCCCQQPTGLRHPRRARHFPCQSQTDSRKI